MIKSILSYKCLNSRASWTIRTRVELENGIIACQTVPDGASKGEREAISLPVEQATKNVNTTIASALAGMDPFDQKSIDARLLEIDGTPNKSNLGANSLLSVSLAVAKVAALSMDLPLYEYLKSIYHSPNPLVFPTPLFNILNGGAHARNDLSFQEFMVVPSMGFSYERKVEVGVDCYNALSKKLLENGYSIGVGDEGGFAPHEFTAPKALSYIVDAVSEAGYALGEDVFLGMDVAAGYFYDADEEVYRIKEEDLVLTSEEMVDYYRDLLKDFPIIYLEDPLDENAFDQWSKYHPKLSKNTMLVGDDLVVTNTDELEKALSPQAIDGVIVKPNQIGTLTETLDFVRMAQNSEQVITVSHRSGETAEDTFIADLALAIGAEFVKFGAPARGERVVKYNRILDVYHHEK